MFTLIDVLPRLWQIASIPLLIYFIVKKMPPKLLIIPALLAIQFVWIFVEPILGGVSGWQLAQVA